MDMESSDRADHVVVEELPRRSTALRPTNLQTLLRYALDASKGDDDPEGHQPLGPMDEERRKHLEEALKGLTVDVPKVLRRGIRLLTNTAVLNNIHYGDQVPDEIRAAFTNMMEFVDDIDVANDFQKMGGFAIFPICYGSENELIRVRASQLLAEICQNNPTCQARVLDFGLLNVLLHLANSERGHALAKCISAISSCIREYEPGCREFIAQSGCEVLVGALKQPYHPARASAAFLALHLCQNYPEAKQNFLQNNIVKVIAEILNIRLHAGAEHMLCILKILIADMEPNILQLFRDPSLNLRNILENYLKYRELEGDAYIEEIEYCKAILKIFENCPRIEVVNNEVDR